MMYFVLNERSGGHVSIGEGGPGAQEGLNGVVGTMGRAQDGERGKEA